MSVKEMFDEMLENIMEDADDAFVPGSESWLPDPAKDTLGGLTLYLKLTDHDESVMDKICRIFEGNANYAKIREAILEWKDKTVLSATDDFCSELTEKLIVKEIPQDMVHLAKNLYLLEGEEARKAMGKIRSAMAEETLEMLDGRVDETFTEKMPQFCIYVEDIDNKPKLVANLNFDSPYYRTDEEIRANTGMCIQCNLKVALEEIDGQNLEESLANALRTTLPALAAYLPSEDEETEWDVGP